MNSRSSMFDIAWKALVSSVITAALGFAVEAWTAQPEGPKRSKVIDFEGELVEGMNKKPLDSLAQITDAERRRRGAHLYRIRRGFRKETAESISDLRSMEGFHQ